MATIYGSTSNYLKYNETKQRVWAFWLIMMLCLLSGFAAAFSADTVTHYSAAPDRVATFAGFFLLYALVFTAIIFFAKKRWISLKQWQIGRETEIGLLKELAKLPDDYSVFIDITIPGRKGNIDYIVLSPWALFIIEVKAHRGHIEYKNGMLFRNGWPIREKNFLRQVYFEHKNLEQYLKRELAWQVPITPVLLFAREGTTIAGGSIVVDGIHILPEHMLLDFLQMLRLKYLPYQNISRALQTLVEK